MKKILIIEDYKTIRELYQKLLQDKGYEVVVAKDGQEGLDLASEGGYDLVLVDLVMPILNGLDVVRNLKDTPPANPNKVLAILYTIGEEANLEEIKKLSINNFILKSTTDLGRVVSDIERLL